MEDEEDGRGGGGGIASIAILFFNIFSFNFDVAWLFQLVTVSMEAKGNAFQPCMSRALVFCCETWRRGLLGGTGGGLVVPLVEVSCECVGVFERETWWCNGLADRFLGDSEPSIGLCAYTPLSCGHVRRCCGLDELSDKQSSKPPTRASVQLSSKICACLLSSLLSALTERLCAVPSFVFTRLVFLSDSAAFESGDAEEPGLAASLSSCEVRLWLK